MAFEPSKGYQALRRGRFSEAGALYFLTFCTAGRNMGLTEVTIAHAVQQEWRAMSLGGVWILRCGTVMPDHVHLLVELGGKLPLSRTIARLKARTAASLRKAGLSWQAGYYDHRVRPQEDILPYFLYTYLNPGSVPRVQQKAGSW